MARLSADVVIIGGGQAGLAMSHLLAARSVDHVVLEREKIASAWRGRWDSLHLVTPNHLTRLPGLQHASGEQNGFAPRDAVVAMIEQYARSFDAPVREGVEVTRAVREEGAGFRLETSEGAMRCRALVVAVGAHGRPFVPPAAEKLSPSIMQLHSSRYRNPGSLPDGPVLVVGAGQSGVQLADELLRAGREVLICAGPCGWLPRTYRGRDALTWSEELGFYARQIDDIRRPDLARRSTNPQMTGVPGRGTLNLAVLAQRGARIFGSLQDADGSHVTVADDLETTLRFGDEFARNFMNTVDRHARENGLDLPEDNFAAHPWQGHLRAGQGAGRVDLRAERVASVLWTTGGTPELGFLPELPWADGLPVHERGVTPIPGLYLLGLHFQYRRNSALIHGVGSDAEHLAMIICRSG